MGRKVFQVDAFTDQMFRGNPAAVCLLTEPLDANWAQNLAMEMNLSETAFLHKKGEVYNLRWFTPTVEVDLCGHATLASAHVLWEQNLQPLDKELVFQTKSGILRASWHDGWIKLDFPAKPIIETIPLEDLLEALGVKANYVGSNKMDYLIEVESPEIVKNLTPDLEQLRKLHVRGVIVTAKANDGQYDFISRFFAPGSGISEDPVTGSAHCCLGPYWQSKLNKDTFNAYQASRRGGTLKVHVQGDRVHLYGKAVTVFKGELTV